MAENRTILLAGRSGSGKSSTGNSITETKVFGIKSRMTTYYCPMETFPDYNDQTLTLIDTPGDFDFVSEAKTMGFESGIHVVVVVVSLRSGFSDEDWLVIERLNEYFGGKLGDYMMLLFTHGDHLEQQGISLDDYLDTNCPHQLAKSLEMCGDRYVVFDNVTEDKFEKYQQREELFSLVDVVMADNGGMPYKYVQPKEFQWEIMNSELESSEASENYHTEDKSSQVFENVSEFDKAYYEDRLLEMESMLQETTQRLENEQLGRMQTEAALTKSNEEISAAREELKRAQEEAEKQRKTYKATKKLLKKKNQIEHQIEEKIRETTLKLENQVAEKFARMQLEEKAREEERKSNDEMRKLREDMHIVQRSILRMDEDHQIVAKLRERNLKLERQLQDEQAGRMQAEVKTQEVEKKANDEISKLREDLDEGVLQHRIRDLEMVAMRMSKSDSKLRGRILELEKMWEDEQIARRQEKDESNDEISKLTKALERAQRDGEGQQKKIRTLSECLRMSQPSRTLF